MNLSKIMNFSENANKKETNDLLSVVLEVQRQRRELTDPQRAWKLTQPERKLGDNLLQYEGLIRTELAGRGVLINDDGMIQGRSYI